MPLRFVLSVFCVAVAMTSAATQLCWDPVVSWAALPPPPLDDPTGAVRRHTHDMTYRYTRHARRRLHQRKISYRDVRWVLRYGLHNGAYDAFEPWFQSWNYAIEGSPRRRRALRVVVSFQKGIMQIVTATYIRRAH